MEQCDLFREVMAYAFEEVEFYNRDEAKELIGLKRQPVCQIKQEPNQQPNQLVSQRNGKSLNQQ